MTKKDNTVNITYSVDSDSLTGGWAPAPENFSVSFSEGDQLDFNDMLRADAGKGLENMKFEDWNETVPFENSVPSLDKINKVCEEYPALRIAYEKFKNVWRICYEDYRSNNKDEGTW